MAELFIISWHYWKSLVVRLWGCWLLVLSDARSPTADLNPQRASLPQLTNFSAMAKKIMTRCKMGFKSHFHWPHLQQNMAQCPCTKPHSQNTELSFKSDKTAHIEINHTSHKTVSEESCVGLQSSEPCVRMCPLSRPKAVSTWSPSRRPTGPTEFPAS